MVRVKGTYKSFLDYISPTKGKKTRDAVLYVASDNVAPHTVFVALVDETLLWHMSDNVTELVFTLDVPKAVKVATIS